MKPTTVYLLDDEPELLELLSDVVEMTDLQPHAFRHASEFFARVTTFESNSILVLDLNMPEMDGVEVMRRLAKMSNSPALILISGHDKGVLHAAEKLGRAHNLQILASLSKPISIDLFQEMLIKNISGLSKNIAIENSETSDTNSIVQEIKQALHNDEFILHYQPQLELATGRLVGAEALIRWQHPKRGLLYPDSFIAIAEQNELIGDITHFVIDAAVRQEQLWQDEGLALNISVNISGYDITSLTLPEQLGDLLASNKMDPTKLTLEITESSLMGELVTSLDILTRLRLKGIGLSIDDFGTGYSSLSQLHRIPFTELKIDRSFVRNLNSDDEARAIVKTCVVLGHELGLKVVAEGVETDEQNEYFKKLGCDIAQGYFFSKPLPETEMTALLRKENS